MSAFATITWSYVPGSLSTLVEYKLHGDTVWIKPTSPNNPTVLNTYTLEVETDTVYDVRLTTNGIACGPRSTTFQIMAPGGACCPPGFTLSEDGSYCYQTNTTAATPPSSPETTVAKTNSVYGEFGTLIYNAGFDIQGYGPYTQISTSNSFWINTGNTLVDGPLNRSGLWATTTSNNQDVGFSVCVVAPTTATYYVGAAADNSIKIVLDGNTVVDMDPTAMAAYLSTHGFPGVGVDLAFKFWHIYPVSLNAGNHVIEIIGHNDSSVAGMGAEIYLLSSAQIQAATSYAAMGSGLIFSSKDYIGMDVQVGSDGIGYSCPDGYSLVLCDGPAYCTQTLIEPTIDCTTTTTTTSTTTTTTTTEETTTTSTTTTTTTTAGLGDLDVENNTTGAEVTIDNITFTTGGGSVSIALPITPGNSAIGTVSASTGILQLTLSSVEVSGDWNAVLTIYSVEIECVSISNPNGNASFSSTTYNIGDSVEITLNNGTCA
jgi:hypothetical protein